MPFSAECRRQPVNRHQATHAARLILRTAGTTIDGAALSRQVFSNAKAGEERGASPGQRPFVRLAS
ncbi:MAG TPA: hypothetical protein VN969_36725 [Streptosporangiaceae bacterium]|nr:hypothetical protein [Streptosporangiaceae bacterium]